MKKTASWFLKHLHIWIALAFIASNAYTWAATWLGRKQPYVVEPVRDPEIVALLGHIAEGGHSGEPWQVTLTQLEADQTITWYLKRYPQIPFAHPRVTITPDYVAGEGDALVAGLPIHVSGKAQVTLKDGLPVVKILDLSLPLPGNLRQTVEDEIQVQLGRAERLPVRFSSAQWRDGEVVVRGYIR